MLVSDLVFRVSSGGSELALFLLLEVPHHGQHAVAHQVIDLAYLLLPQIEAAHYALDFSAEQPSDLIDSPGLALRSSSF